MKRIYEYNISDIIDLSKQSIKDISGKTTNPRYDNIEDDYDFSYITNSYIKTGIFKVLSIIFY
jgi:hypothetical protein